jgi:hypothetical protein
VRFILGPIMSKNKYYPYAMAGETIGGIMPLSEEVAAKKAQTQAKGGPQRNAETDAAIDKFISENKELFEKINGYSKEYLVRQKMLSIMNSRAYRAERNQEILEWAEQNPKVQARIEQRTKNVPEEFRERAMVNIAKAEARKMGMRT